MEKRKTVSKPMHYEKCPVIKAVELIGGKWKLPIIWELSTCESMRYNELKRHLPGITNIMLTRALQSLQNYRLVTRTEYCQIPPHVEYAITKDCKMLLPALEVINEWGKTRF